MGHRKWPLARLGCCGLKVFFLVSWSQLCPAAVATLSASPCHCLRFPFPHLRTMLVSASFSCRMGPGGGWGGALIQLAVGGKYILAEMRRPGAFWGSPSLRSGGDEVKQRSAHVHAHVAEGRNPKGSGELQDVLPSSFCQLCCLVSRLICWLTFCPSVAVHQPVSERPWRRGLRLSLVHEADPR